MSPANTKPVRAWTADRHIDINGDLHLFFDGLLHGKTVLDVGGGLGKSKARIRHSRVTTFDPSPAAEVDTHTIPLAQRFDVVTAFEVIEHVADDGAFLRTCRDLARQAIFLTTPNWNVARCQSADHYREYTQEEWRWLIGTTFPDAIWWWGAAYKDAEGGWADLLPCDAFLLHRGRKHLALIDFGLSQAEREWLTGWTARGAQRMP